MIKIKNKELEKIFGRSVKPNLRVLGFDTASRTGYCRIVTGKTTSVFTYGVVNIKSTDVNYKYNQAIEIFNNLVNDVDIVVIEETYYGRNARVFRMLSRLGGFIYAICHLKGIGRKYFVTAIEARKFLGFSTNVKKEVVHAEFHRKFTKMTIDDVDIVDAIVLAMNAIFVEVKLDV